MSVSISSSHMRKAMLGVKIYLVKVSLSRQAVAILMYPYRTGHLIAMLRSRKVLSSY